MHIILSKARVFTEKQGYIHALAIKSCTGTNPFFSFPLFFFLFRAFLSVSRTSGREKVRPILNGFSERP